MEDDNIKISKRKYIFSKLFLVILSLMICTLNAKYGFILPHGIDTCMWDEGFKLTSELNDLMIKNSIITRFLLILSGIFIDFILLYFLYVFITKITTLRPLLALIIFISIKLICQYMFQLKTPDNSLWLNPGIPSIIMSYTISNSYFFSGPIGLINIVALEFKKINYHYIYFLCVFLIIFETLILLASRGNYIIDILTAILFSHYTFMISDEYTHFLDNFCFKIILKTM